MDLSFIITNNVTLAAIITFMVGLWTYMSRPYDQRNVTFGQTMIAVSAWSLSITMRNRSVTTPEILFWLRSIYLLGTIIPILFFRFALAYGGVNTRSARYTWSTVALLVALAGYTYLTNGVAFSDGVAVMANRGGLILLTGLFGLALTLALLVFAKTSREQPKTSQFPIILILTGTIISFNSVFGILFGTDHEASSTNLFIANAALVVGMFIIASVIVERNFLSRLRLLGPQLFFLVTLFVVAFQMLITQTDIDLLLRAAIAFVLISYIIIMTRTMVQSIRRMNQVETLNEQTMRANRELMEADRMKTRFVSLASHQLRSPIAGVRIYTDMMIKGEFGKLQPQQTDILTKNLGALDRLIETVETFLDAARIQLGKLEIIRTETDLTKLVNQVVTNLEPSAKKKKISLIAKMPSDLPFVSCDEGKIYHVIMNLVDNAVKYTRQGNVTIRAVQAGDEVIMEISDTGIGLSKEEKMAIFDVFQRGMEAVRLDTSGAGLGLFIVKSILDAHGSGIDVESKGRNEGTRFSFRLPMG